MKQNIYFQNLNQEIQQEIIEKLQNELKDEIREVVESGINEETAKLEVVDYYINTHNFVNEFVLWCAHVFTPKLWKP